MTVMRRGRGCGRPDSVDAARDKHSTRAYMAKAGLPTPRNMLIERSDQVEAAGNHVGFPAGGHPGVPQNVDQSRAGGLQALHCLVGERPTFWHSSAQKVICYEPPYTVGANAPAPESNGILGKQAERSATNRLTMAYVRLSCSVRAKCVKAASWRPGNDAIREQRGSDRRHLQ